MTRSMKRHYINNIIALSVHKTEMGLGSEGMLNASHAGGRVDEGRITAHNCSRRICNCA